MIHWHAGLQANILERGVRQTVHALALDLGFLIIRHADHSCRGADGRKASQQAGLRAAAASGVHYKIERDAEGAFLACDLCCAICVTVTSQRMIRCTAGDEIRPLAASGEIFRKIIHRALIFDGALDAIEKQLSAHHAAQKDIAGLPVCWPGTAGPVAMKQGALEARARSRCGRLPCVVGLNRAHGQQSIRTRLQRIAHKEF